MNIEGRLTRLRALEPEDAPALREMINDGNMEYLLGGWSFPVSQREQLAWMETLDDRGKTLLRCAVEEKASGRFAGVVMLTGIDYKNGTAEIHIKTVDGDLRNKGLGSDAIRALTGYAFDELRLMCVYALVNERNGASLRMFEKCGFAREGLLRSRLFKRGERLNVVSLSLCASDRHE